MNIQLRDFSQNWKWKSYGSWFNFSGWYEDEAICLLMLLSIAGVGAFGIDPESGVLGAGETVGINLMYSTYDMVGEYTGNLVLLLILKITLR